MQAQINVRNLMIGTAILISVLFQIGCGGGFNAQNSELVKQLGKATTTEYTPLPDPSGQGQSVPEIAKPDVPTTPTPGTGDVVTPPPASEEPLLDEAGNVVEACSDDYRDKHNEIYELLLKLEAFNKSEKTPEQVTEGLANLRVTVEKCKAFEAQFANQVCKAKLKSNNQVAIASYKSLLQKSCEQAAEAVKKNDEPVVTQDPAVDPTQDPEILNQDLETLMKDQIIEIKIKDSAALLAGSNKDETIETVWVDGQQQKQTLDVSIKAAAEEKKNFCTVVGFSEITGEGTITHRAVSAKNLEAVSGLNVVRVDLTSYLTGTNAGDSSNMWTVKCYGAPENFKPTLASLAKIMGQNIDVEVVGPKQ